MARYVTIVTDTDDFDRPRRVEAWTTLRGRKGRGWGNLAAVAYYVDHDGLTESWDVTSRSHYLGSIEITNGSPAIYPEVPEDEQLFKTLLAAI